MALAAVRGSSSHPTPVKTKSGIFPRRPSDKESGAKTAEVPLFVPDEDDDVIPQVASESEGDEWEDFDEELEEAQVSIAIAQSLELQRQFRRTSDTRVPAQLPILKTPVAPSRQTTMDDGRKAVTTDEDEFTSPSRLATQLSIAGARKPLSTRIPSDSVRGTAAFSTVDIPSISPKKSTHGLTPIPVLGRPSSSRSEGDAGDEGSSDEDDDMEEVTIPEAATDRPLTPPEPLANPDAATAADPAGTPLAIGVEDVVAKRFAEFQKIFAEKRSAFRAENQEVPVEVRQARELSRVHSPGLEYADNEVGVIEVEERWKETIDARSSPPPRSDEDEDMEEIEVPVAPSSVLPRVPQPSTSSRTHGPSATAVRESFLPKRVEETAVEEDEDVPISDWSRSPSPRPRPPAGEAGPSAPALALDSSRGLLDPDESFEKLPPGERDREHEDFDAAHEMDIDAEAGEFARWMSQVKGRNLDDVRKEIEQEINGLRKEQKAAMRDSEDITGQMIAQIMVSLAMRHAGFAYQD